MYLLQLVDSFMCSFANCQAILISFWQGYVVPPLDLAPFWPDYVLGSFWTHFELILVNFDLILARVRRTLGFGPILATF